MFRRFTRSSIAARLGLVLLSCCLPSLSGCALIFRHHQAAPHFTMYSDHDREFLGEAAVEAEQIYRGFEKLFPGTQGRLGRTAIILRGGPGDLETIDLNYSPSLLGYYIPLLNLISVDTKPAWTRERRMLQQILLHEIAHHFILTASPESGNHCWINEGLAGNLEMTLFEGEHFEYPLLNPVLFAIARQAIQIDPAVGDARKLIDLNWSGFHDEARKEVNYAAAWSLVHFILERHLPRDLPLGDRIERLLRMEREEIVALSDRWRAFLREEDLTGRLIEIARGPAGAAGRPRPLSARWALRELGSLSFLDARRAGRALVECMADRDPVISLDASLAFLELLSRQGRPSFTDAQEYLEDLHLFGEGRRRIAERLRDPFQPSSVRELLVESLGELPRTDRGWIPILIELLDDPHGPVRSAAAHALSVSQMKPTIVNPEFWERGKPSARAAEVAEWRTCWVSYPVHEGAQTFSARLP